MYLNAHLLLHVYLQGGMGAFTASKPIVIRGG